jgi:hypothetical protein
MSELPAAIDIERVKAKGGGATTLAHKLSALGKPITPQGVRWWKRVPIERVKHVSEITGLPLYRLRPDIYRWRRKAVAP